MHDALASNWLNLEDRTCVVTGAASGIGAAIAGGLARQGARVALLDRNVGDCERVATELEHDGASVISVACDVSQEANVKAAAEQVEEELGGCFALVNAAGVLRASRLDEIDLDDWNDVLSINLTGYLLCAREFGQQMLTRNSGSMVHIASVAAHHPQTYSGAYSPSKAAISILSKQIAAEWGPSGVRSNVISPGMIRTELSGDFYAQPGVTEQREAFTASRRIGQPNDIANAALFLLSDRAAYINGSEIGVDGGLPCMLMDMIPRPGFSAT